MSTCCKIPKIIFQTSREKPPQYLINMIKCNAPLWNYEHYTDSDIIDFFLNNPLEEFPLIVDKFKNIRGGAHKADLFRYYYLYIKGGVFLDSDAMLQTKMIYCAKNYDFFTVNSSYCSGCIFQGFIGATPKNPIIYDALKDTYNIDVNALEKDYLLLCRNLYNMLKYKKYNLKMKIYQEIEGPDGVALTVNPNDNKLILAHYYVKKIVPKNFFHYKSFILNKIRSNKTAKVIL
jgi:hypothetical protein